MTFEFLTMPHNQGSHVIYVPNQVTYKNRGHNNQELKKNEYSLKLPWQTERYRYLLTTQANDEERSPGFTHEETKTLPWCKAHSEDVDSTKMRLSFYVCEKS